MKILQKISGVAWFFMLVFFWLTIGFLSATLAVSGITNQARINGEVSLNTPLLNEFLFSVTILCAIVTAIFFLLYAVTGGWEEINQPRWKKDESPSPPIPKRGRFVKF
jgi:hypothetical protein